MVPLSRAEGRFAQKFSVTDANWISRYEVEGKTPFPEQKNDSLLEKAFSRRKKLNGQKTIRKKNEISTRLKKNEGLHAKRKKIDSLHTNRKKKMNVCLKDPCELRTVVARGLGDFRDKAFVQ